jgi:hypothetical protein
MKTRYLLLTILLAIIAHDAIAQYNRHDGSNYSCNIIWTERAYAQNTKQPKKAHRLTEELKKYCPGDDDE